MQLLLLNDHVSVSGSESPLADSRDPYVDLRALAELGIIELRDTSPALLEVVRSSENLSDVWKDLDETLRDYESFILTQLDCINLKLHWSILRLLAAVRTRDHLRISLLEPAIPSEYTPLATLLLSGEGATPEVVSRFDINVLDTTARVKDAFDLATAEDTRIAGGGSQSVPRSLEVDVGYQASQLWQILVNQLLAERIEFPVPESLRAVIRLRGCPEIKAFREFFFPFLNAVVAGEADTTQRLRKEVLASVRSMRRLPVARKVADWVTYASMPVGVIEALSGLMGTGLATAIIPIGLQHLAKIWAKRCTWLYLSKNPYVD